MFKKPLAHQSNATPLRSSVRRQLLRSIGSQYPLLIPAEDGEEVGKVILPKGVRTSTFETSGGVEGVGQLQLHIVIGSGLMDSNSGLILILVMPSGCHLVGIQRNSSLPVSTLSS